LTAGVTYTFNITTYSTNYEGEKIYNTTAKELTVTTRKCDLRCIDKHVLQ